MPVAGVTGWKPGSVKKKLFGGLVAVLILLFAAAAAVYVRGQQALLPMAETADQELFVVNSGAILGRVARELQAQGFIRDARAFEWVAHKKGKQEGLRVGEYWISAAQTPEQILDRLSSGRVATYPLVIPEGFTAAMVAARLEAEGLADAEAFLAVVNDPEIPKALGVEGPTLEGYLFPETYQIPRGLSARVTAKILVDHFLALWRELAPAATERGMSMREVVTLASIVEKETGAAKERPLIASVFHNRLKRGMRLESDPTTIYGIPNFDGNLRRRDLENADNPYNTYRIRALPPGAIANPGADALRAVLDPADTKFLYFVSRNDGTHKFSKSYQEHVVAVNNFQRRRRR